MFILVSLWLDARHSWTKMISVNIAIHHERYLNSTWIDDDSNYSTTQEIYWHRLDCDECQSFFSRYLLWYRPLQVILFVGLERKNWWLVSWSIMRSSQVTADDVLHALQCVFNSIQANAWHSANKRGIKSCTSPTRRRTGVRSVEWIYWRKICLQDAFVSVDSSRAFIYLWTDFGHQGVTHK